MGLFTSLKTILFLLLLFLHMAPVVTAQAQSHVGQREGPREEGCQEGDKRRVSPREREEGIIIIEDSPTKL